MNRHYNRFMVYIMLLLAEPASHFQKLLASSSSSVAKLTDRNIRWIIKEKSRDVLSTTDSARLQKVSESRIRQLL
jgi:hypothetical protein